MRPLFLAVLLLTIALVPATQAEEGVHIGVPTAGSVARYDMTYRSPDRVISAWNITDTWGALETVRDGYDLARPAYKVVRDDGCDWDYPCDPFTYWIDPATRLAFEYNGRGGAILTLGQSRLGPLMSERYFDFTYDMHVFTTSPVLEWIGHGLYLSAGETYDFPVPPSSRYPHGGEATLVATGWETVDDRSLFRVEARAALHEVGNWSTTLWYDGHRPVPVRTLEDYSFDRCGPDGCTPQERHVIGRLGHYEAGTEALVAPFTDERTRRDDVVRVPLRATGPADMELASFPRAEALAEVAAHPAATAWFERHPDAYLVFGTGREDSRFAQEVSWRLGWGDGKERLNVELVRPFAAGAGAPLTTQVSVMNETMTFSYPAFSDLPPGPIACMEQARRDLRERLGAVETLRPDTDVWWWVDPRHPQEPICSVAEYAPVALPAIEEHRPGGVALTERGHVLVMTIGADSGSLRYMAEGRTGSVDRFWLPGHPLP